MLRVDLGNMEFGGEIGMRRGVVTCGRGECLDIGWEVCLGGNENK